MKLEKLAIPVLAALMLVGTTATPCAAAGDLPGANQYQVTTENGLEVSISPLYLWLPGMNGTLGVFGAEADLSLSPIDILKDLGDFIDALDGLYMGAGEIRYDKAGFFYDIVYLDFSHRETIEKNVLEATADVSFELTMATMAGTYRFYEDETKHVDVLGGVRVWDVDLNVGLDLNGRVGDNFSDGDTWVDPVIGVKAGADISENVYVKGWAMIGGFGAGSDFMWDVFGGAGYEFNDWFSAFAGIRATGADYTNNSFKWDMTMYGPMIGLGVKF